MTRQSTQRDRRRDGDGSIFWNATRQLYIGRTPPDRLGKRREVSASNRDECVAKLRRLVGVTAEQRPRSTGRTVAMLLEDWLVQATRHLDASTRLDYEGIVRDQLLPVMGNMPLATLDRATCVRAVEAASTGLADTRRPRRTLSAALSWGADHGYLSTNALFGVRMERSHRGNAPRFDDADVAATLDALTGEPLEPLLRFQLHTGMRPSEAYALTWDSIDWRARTAEVWQTYSDKGSVQIRPLTKNDSSRRVVQLSDDAIAALQLSEQLQKTWERDGVPARYRRGAGRSSGYVNAGGFAFTNTQGGHWTHAAVRRARLSAGAPMPTGLLRHAFGTAAVDSVPRELAKAVMGHGPRSSVLDRHYDQGRPAATRTAAAEAISTAIRERFEATEATEPPRLRVVDSSRRLGG
jgi:integrase